MTQDDFENMERSLRLGFGTDEIALARFQGWSDCIGSVRASLEMYPHGGGDIGIMREVQRLIQEAVRIK